MAFSPISFIAVNYRDYRDWWLKAYEPATTTAKPLALESDGGTQVAKLQLNKDGFLESAGGAIVMPYIDGSYDAYLFPTESEADSNDTSNAVRVADDIMGVRGTDDYIAIKPLAEAIADTSAEVEDYVYIIEREDIFKYEEGETPDEFSIITCTGVPTLSLVLQHFGEITLKSFGVESLPFDEDKNNGVSQNDAIEACFAYAATQSRSEVDGGSTGYIYVDRPVELTANYKARGAAFRAMSTFVGDNIVKTAATSLKIDRLIVRGWDNATKVADLIGFRVDDFNCKLDSPDIQLLDYGVAINSFSCSIINGTIAGNNTNVSAWAESSSKEISALTIDGGEYFGARDYAFNIGDQRFPSSVPSGTIQGSKIKITNVTTDKSCIKLDKVMGVEISAYFEGSDSPVQDSYVSIGNSDGSMVNIKIHDCTCNNSSLDATAEYFVKCDNAVRGLVVDNIQYSKIPKCAVYTTSDIYPVTIGNLSPTNSHGEAPQWHLGVRIESASNATNHNIFGVWSEGKPTPTGTMRRCNISDEETSGMVSEYIGEGWYSTISAASSSCSVTGSHEVTLTSVADAVNYSGGMYVNIGGIKTSIATVNYETGVIKTQSYALTTETTIQRATGVKKRSEFYAFEPPTDTTTYQAGSRAWNRFTVTQSPDYWVLKAAGWVAAS